MAGGLLPIHSFWRQAPWGTQEFFIFQMNTCCYSPYVTSSLMRGWVCRLQVLLGLASTVILRSESQGTHDHILLSKIQDSTNLEGQIPRFIIPRNRVAHLYPRHWVPFSVPPTTRGAIVEVFDPTSTWDWSWFLCLFTQPLSWLNMWHCSQQLILLYPSVAVHWTIHCMDISFQHLSKS
jgi:hypothetical protein